MPLHPGLVGRRVIVRRVVPGQSGLSGGPAMTDVLGILEHWGEESLQVRRGDGEVVDIPLDEVVTGKEIPPPPSSRRRG